MHKYTLFYIFSKIFHFKLLWCCILFRQNIESYVKFMYKNV